MPAKLLPKTIDDFNKEVAMMASFHSSKTVDVRGACTTQPGKLIVVMELAELGSLRELLDGAHRDFAATPAWRLRALLDIAHGMKAIHAAGGAFHRDLKSLNVLVTGEGRCKIADFGRSKKITVSATATASGNIGTYAWSAPETLEDNAFTGASDVYAFGIIVWEMLTKKVPWEGHTPAQITLKVTQGKRPFPVPKASAVRPPQLVALMRRCWAQAPEVRPAFPEIVRELHQLKAATSGVRVATRRSWWNTANDAPDSPGVA